MFSFVCFFLFNQLNNNAVREPRTRHFRGLVGFEAEAKTKDLKMRPRGQVFENSIFGLDRPEN